MTPACAIPWWLRLIGAAVELGVEALEKRGHVDEAEARITRGRLRAEAARRIERAHRDARDAADVEEAVQRMSGEKRP